MNLVNNFSRWSWWKILGWFLYALLLAVIAFAMFAAIWWVAMRAISSAA